MCLFPVCSLLGAIIAIVLFHVALKNAVELGVFERPDEEVVFRRDAAMLAGPRMHDQSGEPIRLVTKPKKEKKTE